MFRPRPGSFLRPALYAVTAAGLGYSGYWIYSSDLGSRLSGGPSFDIRIRQRSSDGRTVMTTKSISQLPDDQIEALLRANAKSESIARPYGVTWRHATASLNSNNPIEDASAQLILRNDTKGQNKTGLGIAGSGDLLFFAVMDGHAGPHTSRLLAKALIPAVALELSTLDRPSVEKEGIDPTGKSTTDYLKATLSYIVSLLPASLSPFTYSPSTDPKYVQLAIQTAFANLDSEIVNAPIRILEMLQAKAGTIKPWEHPMAEASMLPALSGSCALLAILDTARRDLHVAVTGDSRAVAGYWDEDANGEGKWRVEVLTEDQTGRNINEYKRLTSSLLPPGSAFRKCPSNLKTPPYVTSQPVITRRGLHFLPSRDYKSQPKAASRSKSTLRFLILATDGLWDELSSSEVVSLVGGHFEGRKGSVSKSELAETVVAPAETAGVEGKSAESKAKQGSTEGEWAFVDENVGTHLIRNAFGGADRERLNQMLSIPAPYSRRYRDDVTVTVVWWEPDTQEGESKVMAKL
ncbi:hypothetical protein FRC09_000541 [Ceratobasidium sp. 395]|nr:hypothetical protein FRC09_000541 [Ceratobasidium sp. 395]